MISLNIYSVSDKIIKKIRYKNKDTISMNFSRCKNSDEVIFDSELDQYRSYLISQNILEKKVGNVPEIYFYDDYKKIAYCQYLGTSHLYEKQEKIGAIINWTKKLQSIKKCSIKKIYDKKCLEKEMEHFNHFVLEKGGRIKINDDDQKILNEHYAKMCQNIDLQKKVLCHRNFQSKNIMIHKDNFYIIDFQDLCWGSQLYDLCSLLSDIHLSDKTKEKILNKLKKNFLEKDIYMTTLHRLLKDMIWIGKKYFIENDLSLIKIFKKKIDIVAKICDILSFSNFLVALNKYFPSYLSTVILAAGKGSRMKKSLKDKKLFLLPKALVPILKRPMIHYVLDVANNLKSDHIIIVVGYKKELIISNLKGKLINFVYQEKQLGTAHAVHQTESFFGNNYQGNILILMGDNPIINVDSLEQMKNCHRNYDISVLSVLAKKGKQYGLGRIVRNKNGKLIPESSDSSKKLGYTYKTTSPNHHFNKNGKFGYTHPSVCRLIDIVEEKDIKKESTRNILEVSTGIFLCKGNKMFEYIKKIKNNNSQKEYYLPSIIKYSQKINVYLTKKTILSANDFEQLERIKKFLKK